MMRNTLIDILPPSIALVAYLFGFTLLHGVSVAMNPELQRVDWGLWLIAGLLVIVFWGLLRKC